MGTVALKQAEILKANNGVFPGDEHLPPVVLIVEYSNAFNGAPAYGLVYKGMQNPYVPSDYVRNPRVWWQREDKPRD